MLVVRLDPAIKVPWRYQGGFAIHGVTDAPSGGLSGPQSGWGADGGARIRDRWVYADIRADSLATVQPTTQEQEEEEEEEDGEGR
ncbi:hypothetical protein PoB_003673000 [Plakobranchus ocellatus]|uniref:Uncharacterized protein n=1 Tax=Plakobranchus ocellatus TaxID=259542 RepID=A0AAV4APN3_9GAST|nr:hypothetical protein PoB_003673000 [Plakobranchus ocellatus]